jgi:type IV secretion system protein VirB6
MSGFCPSIGPDTPLVRGLLGSVDCNVQGLVQAGYAALLQGPTGFAEILTALMTIYVAVIGYRLMLGRAGLSPSQFALTAVKLGVVLTLATQWSAYQTLVYRFLFDGPQQLADGILHQIRASGGASTAMCSMACSAPSPT